MSKQKVIWIAVLAVGVGLVGLYVWTPDVVNRLGAEIEPQLVESPSPSPTVTPEHSQIIPPIPLASQPPQIVNKYPPAECSLTGSITFISPGLYENKDANIIYKNIDSIARLVIWKISPNDGLSVGPNLFANLPLPDGTEDVTIGLPENPKSKNYILTANVTYGVIVNRNLEIKESSCSGQIPVEIKY